MKGLTITAALVALVVAYIARVQGLLTDAFVLESLVALAYLLLCWAGGIGATEVHKRKRIPRPWTTPEAQDAIWLASTCYGGIPYASLLLARHWPPSAEGVLLILIVGLGLGGGVLPFVYKLLANTLWPWLRGQFVKLKWVQRKGEPPRAIGPGDEQGDDEHTVVGGIGAATEVPPREGIKPEPSNE